MNRLWIRMTFLLAMSAGLLWVMGCERTSAQGNAQPAAKAGDSSSQTTPAAQPETIRDGVLVYYLHGDRRCPTCLGIQARIEEVLRERFAAEQAAQRLMFRDVNYDQDANKPIARQFEISFSSMVVARVQDGKITEWENCDKVWEYAHDAPRLKEYAAERIRAYLEKAGAK